MQPAAPLLLILQTLRLHRLPPLLRQRETLLKLRARRLLHRLVQLRLQAHRLLRLTIQADLRLLRLELVNQRRPAIRPPITQAEARVEALLAVGVRINTATLQLIRGTPLLLPARRVLLATLCTGTVVILQTLAVLVLVLQQQHYSKWGAININVVPSNTLLPLKLRHQIITKYEEGIILRLALRRPLVLVEELVDQRPHPTIPVVQQPLRLVQATLLQLHLILRLVLQVQQAKTQLLHLVRLLIQQTQQTKTQLLHLAQARLQLCTNASPLQGQKRKFRLQVRTILDIGMEANGQRNR